jgi:hypothetical protein
VAKNIVGSLPFSVTVRELDHIEYERYWDVTNATGQQRQPRRRLCPYQKRQCLICPDYAKCIYTT